MVTLREAKEVSDAIRKGFSPICITVFGSTAREGIGNDLDLLIVLDDSVKPLDQNIDRLLYGQLKDFYKRFAIDPFVTSLSAFRKHYLKGSPFLRLILREGRLLYMKDAAKEWFRQSEDELKMADYLLRGGFYRGACLHAQQAIEKALKALLLGKGWELEKTHSAERLLVLAEEYRITIDVTEDDIVYIDSIYRGRYPAEAGLLPLGEPTVVEAQRAVGIAKGVMTSAATLVHVHDRDT